MKWHMHWVAAAAAVALMTACGGGGDPEFTSVKVAGDSLADSGTFGVKFTVQGGAAMGYHRAGFEVVGVDIEPQPRYPFEFVQADALEYLAAHGHEFDAIHASPPCQDHSTLRSLITAHGTGWMLGATIDALADLGRPYVVENVAGADLDGYFRIILCGSMFHLGATCDDGTRRQLRRHRQFVTNMAMMQPECHHDGPVIGVYGQGSQRGDRGYGGNAREAADALGIDWMTRAGLSQSIPPAYTEFIGWQLVAALAVTP